MPQTLDVPWRRRGRAAYAVKRVRAAIRPPVTVHLAPSDIVQDHDVAVAMRDGVTLRVNVYRPPGDGRFPVILSAHPYGKDATPGASRSGRSLNPQYRIMTQPEPVTISDLTGWEAPDPAWWAGHGYAVINADERGAGASEGVGSMFTDDEARDVYDLIEWAGAQPWSNGNVGMLGVSYLAISQYKAAALRPPSLKAICPWEGFSDAYRDFMTPGGVVENGFARIWLLMAKRVERTRQNLAADRKKHPLRDAWWESLTPDLAKIRVPMLVCVSFSDANLHSSGSQRAFWDVGSRDRFAYMHRGAKWATFYGEEAKAAQLAFFDRYLREQDVPAPPPVRLEVRDRRDHIVEVREENEWPLARTEWRSLYLGNSGEFTEARGSAGAVTFDLRRNAAAFTFAFSADTEITGPMNLRLWVSVDSIRPGKRKTQDGKRDASVFVGVEKWSAGEPVPFEGSYGYGRDRIAGGRQLISLRELDRERSSAHRPEHAFRTPQPVAAGEVVQLDIPLSPSATLFRAGDSLRLLVAGRYLEPRNPFFGHFPTSYLASQRGRCTLHWSTERPARLEVPVIPPTISG